MTQMLQGLRVAITEHRYTSQLGQLLQRHGAIVYSYPLVQETPAEDSAGARRFMAMCETSPVDYIVFYTGVGVDFLFRAENKPEVVARSKVLARGPKAVAALRRAGVRIDFVADAPTTEGIIETLSREDLQGKSVLVQLYGTPNVELTEALEAEGAKVTGISLYRYTQASDGKAIDELVDKILNGAIDAITFTSAPQVRFLLQAAAGRGKEIELLKRFHTDVLIASIGEVTGRALQEAGLHAQVIPEEPKMGRMVEALVKYVEQRRQECSTPSSST
jgi:uroporphyrinogen-III synthase